MFPSRYFANRIFAPRYFPKSGQATFIGRTAFIYAANPDRRIVCVAPDRRVVGCNPDRRIVGAR